MEIDTSISCGVCEEDYSSGSRKPVILPCGHTFCRPCILHIKDISGVTGTRCPNCRKAHTITSIEELPLNFSVLSISETLRINKKAELCAFHNEAKRFWCSDCQLSVCALCTVESHRDTGHHVVKMQYYLKERNYHIARKFDTITAQTEALQQSINMASGCDVMNLLMDLKLSHEVANLKFDLAMHADHLRNGSEVIPLKESEDVLIDLQEKASGLSSRFGELKDERIRMATEIFSQRPNKTARNSQQRQGTDLPEGLVHSFSGPLTMSAMDGNGHCASMTWEGDRLHVSTFREETNSSDFIMKWSLVSRMLPKKFPEVFLELSEGGRRLGRIYIRLWGHLRRAQHFMFLCLGSLGPTYSKSYIIEKKLVDNLEFLVGGEYATSDGSTSMEAVMEDLEWGGSNAVQCRKGLVTGFSNGNSKLDALFAIVIKPEKGAVCNGPFGEVISGFDVVLKASQHTPTSDVMISRCGVTIPFFKINGTDS